jgi:hypothetical protein
MQIDAINKVLDKIDWSKMCIDYDEDDCYIRHCETGNCPINVAGGNWSDEIRGISKLGLTRQEAELIICAADGATRYRTGSVWQQAAYDIREDMIKRMRAAKNG